MDGQVQGKIEGAGRLSRSYFRQSVWLTAGMFLAGLFLANVFRFDVMLTPLIVSAVFSLAVDTADAAVWRRVAERSPESLTTFYTAVSGFRMLLALVTMLVYYLVAGSDAMLVFFLVFMAFYVMLLIHHTAFFAKVSDTRVDK